MLIGLVRYVNANYGVGVACVCEPMIHSSVYSFQTCV